MHYSRKTVHFKRHVWEKNEMKRGQMVYFIIEFAFHFIVDFGDGNLNEYF